MKSIKISMAISGIIGLVMLPIAISFLYNTHSFLREAVKTEGTVVDFISSPSSSGGSATTYAPVVHFQIPDGRIIELISDISSYPPSFTMGETVGVYYLPSQPKQARIDSFFSLWGVGASIGGMGLVFCLTSFFMFLISRLNKRKAEYLKRNGQAVQATYQGVEINSSFTVNGRSPYRVVTHWKNPVTGELHIFKSENLWYNPADHLKEHQYITVYLELSNPKKYWVDTSVLPKLANS